LFSFSDDAARDEASEQREHLLAGSFGQRRPAIVCVEEMIGQSQ
jgi:hypothetical protein